MREFFALIVVVAVLFGAVSCQVSLYQECRAHTFSVFYCLSKH